MKKPGKLISIVSVLFMLAMLFGAIPSSIFASAAVNAEIAESIQTSENDIRPLAVTGDTITPLTVMMYYVHGSYTTSGGVFPLRKGTDLTLLGDAAFCSQHEKSTPTNGVEMTYVGHMSDYLEGDLTDGLTAQWAYRVIKSAQGLMNKSEYSALTIYQKLQAIQIAINYPDELHSSYSNGVEGGSYTATQAKQMYALYGAIDKAARSSNLQLPAETKITYTRTGGNYFSGSNYVIGTYTLNFTGVTAKVNSNSTSGVTASVSGKTLTVSIPASKIPTNTGYINASVSLSASEQTIETIDLYVEGTGKKQMLLLLDEYSYSPTNSLSASVRIPAESGGVEITKVDSADESKGLAGAVFQLKNRDTGETQEFPATNSSGYTSLTNLRIGRYTITEKTPPSGYALSNWSQDIEITANSTTPLRYTVTNRALTVTWSVPEVHKTLNGYAPGTSGQYIFELLRDGKVIDTQTDQQGTTYYTYVHFGSITFTGEDAGKTYVFTIREKNTGTSGVVYDTAVAEWNVTVTDSDGSLTVNAVQTKSLEDNTFKNYAPTGSWTPSVNKVLEGSALTNGQFTFTLSEGSTVLQRVTNRADGSIPFSAIKYTADDTGKHTYVIREIAGSDGSITYDSHSVTVVVNVEFDGDETLAVIVESVSGSTTFTNRYLKEGSWTPSVTKSFPGGSLTDGMFTFILTEGGCELQRTTNKADGTVTFKTIQYTSADVGEHIYTITELNNGLPGVVYDTHTLTYTVKVSDLGDSELTVWVSSNESTTFTNKYETTDITATKVWADNDNQDGLRADVNLTLSDSDGNKYTGTIKLGETSFKWSDLPIYNDTGERITYSLTEAEIDGYFTTIEKGADGYTFVVTNTHEPAVTSVSVIKVWDDSNNQDGLRSDVHLTLSGSNDQTYSGVIPMGETSFTWDNLPVYMDGGQIVEYSLTEAEIDGYDAVIIKGEDGYIFEITNTHIPEVIEIPVRKIWEDRDNSLCVRPDNITVVLYGSNRSERMATIRAIDDWSYTFQNLPKYWNNGNQIEYTLVELPVHGYTTEIVKGEDEYSFTVFNTLVFGRLHIIKNAEDGYTEGLRFRIYGVSHQGTTVDIVAVTGADGVARVDYILPGSYYVEEIDIPDRYVAPDRQTVIVVGDDSDPEITVISFYNELKRMSVIVNKTAEDGVLSGHRFKIEGTDYLDNQIDRVGLTDENGEVVFDDLLAGDYVITEIDTDIRYVVPEDQDVTVTWVQDETVSFHNSLKYWRLTVRKTDAATGEPVAGAVYGICKDGVLLDEYITDENGSFTSIQYRCGEGYTLKEISPAPGFTLDGTVYEILGTSAEDCITVLIELDMEVTDTPTHVTITKTDITTGKPLPGAEITIFDANGNVVYTAVTDENGEIEAFYLPVGIYTFRETYSPDGFIINENTFIFEILEDGSILGDTEIEDEPYTVTLTKIESTSKTPVQGGVIEVYGKDGNLIGQFTTDVNGEIFMRELIPGIYTYKEIFAPDGYVLNDMLHTFTLNEDGSVSGEITFENARIEPTVPKTGDHTLLVGGLALLSLVCIILFICKRKRYDNDD